MLTAPWRIEMFGGLRARRGGEDVRRFRRGTEAALLAYLAFHPKQGHPREEIVDRFWPDADIDAGRLNLRVALSSLRRRLEPPGTPAGSVVVAENTLVRLNPAALVTDVAEFEAAVNAAGTGGGHRIRCLEAAVALYAGELLPGHRDGWVETERQRLRAAYVHALCALAGDPDGAGGAARAVDCACRAVAADPLHEAAHLTLIRLYAREGRADEALKQYARLRRRLRTDLGQEPSEDARRLAGELRARPRSFIVSRPAPDASVDRPAAPTPSGAVPGRAAHLPCPVTRFFGREEEIGRIRAVFGQSGERLVTLAGPGGTGKTRLAVQAAHGLPWAGAGRAWFVPLADVADPDLIPQAVLMALGEKPDPARDPLRQAGDALSGPPALLVLDNYEQLVEAGAPVLLGLLERTPGLSCLVTSRRHLGVPGERVVDVPPLPLPEPSDTLERLAGRPSVRLFVDRAQARAPEFQVTARNRQAVTDLVRGLEGIPLALEMAAVWVRVRTPARMVTELEDRYGLLSRNLGGVPDRHGTLHKAVAWSYDLLTPEAQRFLASLSAFRGGWTPEAAEAVSGEPGADGLLVDLLEHSWVTSEEEDGGVRFRMLETLREFAGQRLGAQAQAGLGRRHADHYWRFYQEAKHHLDGPGQGVWVARAAAEWDNLSAAVLWYLADDEGPERVLRLASDLCRFCEIGGHPGAGRSFLEAALAKPGSVPAAVRGPALNSVGWLAFMQGDHAAALPHFEGALAAAREAADREDEAIALGNLGVAAQAEGRYDEAASYFGRSGDLAREVGHGLFEANARGNLANLLKSRGRYAEAVAQYRACVGLFEALGNARSEAIVWINMGDALCRAGRLPDGRGPYRRALGISHGLRDRWLLAACFEGLADILAGAGRTERAVRLLGAASRLRREAGVPVAPDEREAFERSVGARRQALGAAAFLRAYGEGEGADLERAVGWASEEDGELAEESEEAHGPPGPPRPCR